MKPSKEDIKDWLKRENHTREWLGQQCGNVSKNTVNNWLSTSISIPGGALTIISRLMDDDKRAEEQRLKNDANPQSHLVIKVDADEFNAWEKLAVRKNPPQTVTDYCLAAIQDAYRREMHPELTEVEETPENLITFPEIPLLHAAAGHPITADGETYAPTRPLGPGRFACQLHGDSMTPKYPSGTIVILRTRDSLKRQVLKKGETYLFNIEGQNTLKIYSSRPATAAECASGIAYTSKLDGKQKVCVLKSINPAFPDIRVNDDIAWLGWLDKSDN